MKCETVYQGVWTLFQVTVHVRNAHVHILKCIYQSSLPLNPPCCLIWITGQVLSSVTVEEKNCENHLSDCGDFPKQSCPWHVLTHQQFNTVFRLDVIIALRFSLYHVFLNDQSRKEKHGRSHSPACLSLSCVGFGDYNCNSYKPA